MKNRLHVHRAIFPNAFRAMARVWDGVQRSGPVAVLCLSVLALAPAGLAQDVTFNKTRYSSVKQPGEADVVLTLTDSKILIKDKKANGIDMEIPYSSIDSISYELATRHRVAEGAGVMALSIGAGAIVMATKTKSYWLDIEHHDGDAKELTVLRLDKSEHEQVMAALAAKSRKHIEALATKGRPLNPTVGSKDMDEVIPFGMEAVAAALKPAMESFGCNVTEAKDKRIECKRPRGYSERTGSGAEKVTATLEAKGDQTRVRIWTGKGFVGRIGKNNWSTPIYEEMMKNLQKPAQSATASGPN
ncbi:MAG: hypothetical protein ACRD59_11880 [Candidatus Acidiferrales bacterium]